MLFHTTAAENLKHVVWVSSTAHQTQTGGDVVTVAQGALDHCVRVGFHRTTNLSQALTLRQLLVDHVIRAVIWGNRQSPEVTFIGQRDRAVDGCNWCTVLRVTCLKQFLNTWQTTGNIATDTTLVEGTHGQLGTRLTNGLSSNNTDGFADINQVVRNVP